jgi:hypothetical protein
MIGTHWRGVIISEAELVLKRFYREAALIGSPSTVARRVDEL